MKRLIALIALLSAFPPLATDMYLPAIPHLTGLWGQPLSVVNLTLVLFFVTYCICLLIYGPLSDRYGRKPPLLFGIGLFIAASGLCTMANGIWALIIARILQAAGAAAASAISIAITKDRLDPRRRQSVLGYIAVIMALAPMVSPMIGSLILSRLSWPWIFAAQGFMGAVGFFSVLAMEESHRGTPSAPLKDLALSYGRVLTNGRFMGVVACTSLVGLPLFAFIAGSSSIYISDFHLSEQAFSLFFGGNALCFMAGSMICARFGSRLGSARIMSLGFAGILTGGVLMASGMITGPWSLGLPMGIITFFLGLSRPPANNLALEQVAGDAGTASSTMMFSYFMAGAVAMAAVSLDWQNKVGFIAILSVTTGALTLALWNRISTRIILPENPESEKILKAA